MQLFPNARHAEKKRGADFTQVALDRAQALGKVDHHAGVQRQIHRVNLLGHVAQRQIRYGRIGRRALVDRVGAHGHRIDVAVGNHRRLGAAGRARGKDHQGDVVFGLRREPRCDQVRLLCLKPCPQRADVFNHDQVRQLRQARAHLEHLVELLLVFTHDDACVRCRKQVFDLRRRRGWVDAHRHGVDHPRPQLREHPFLAVLADDRHMAFFGQTQRSQTEREMPRVALVVTP